MANVFNFGIGLTVADDATKKIDDAFTSMASKAQGLASTFSGISESLNLEGFINDQAFNLADATANITAEMGGATAQTKAAQEAIFEMSTLTGRSVETFSGLAGMLGESGIKITDLSKATHTYDAATKQVTGTVWGEREALGGLVDAFGLTNEEAIKMARGAHLLGDNFQTAADDVAGLQQALGVTGIIKQLPEIMEGARTAMVEFGASVTGPGPEMRKSISETGAILAKSIGTNAAEAVQLAIQSFKKFSGEIHTTRKVMLGLESDFGPATKAMFELGLGFQESQDMLKMGQKSPVEFAQNIKRMTDQLAATGPGGALQAARVIEQLSDAMSGTPVERFLRSNQDLTDAIAAQASVYQMSEENTGKFQETVKAMWNTGKVALSVFKNLVGLGKVMIGVFGEDILKHVFIDIGNSVKDINKKIMAFTSNLEKNKAFQDKIKPSLIFVGKVMLAVSTATGAAVTALGGLFVGTKAIAGLSKAANLLLGPMKALTGIKGTGGLFKMSGLFKGLGGVITGFGKKILWPLTILNQLKITFTEFGKTLSNPKMLSGDKFVAIVGGAVKTVAGIFDSMLFGIPSMITKVFFPKMQGGFREGIGAMVDSVMSGFKGVSLRDAFRQWTTQALDALGSMASSIGDFFSSGEAKTMLGDGIRELFLGIGLFIRAAASSYKDVFLGVWDAILAKFGSSTTSIKLHTTNLFLHIWKGLKWIGHRMEDAWQIAGVGFKAMALGLKTQWNLVSTALSVGASLTVAVMKNKFTNAVSFIKQAFAMGLVPSIKLAFESVFQTAVNTVANTIKGVINTISMGIGRIMALVRNMPKSERLVAQLKKAQQAAAGISSAITKVQEKTVEASKGRADAVKSGLKDVIKPYEEERRLSDLALARSKQAAVEKVKAAITATKNDVVNFVEGEKKKAEARHLQNAMSMKETDLQIENNNKLANAANAELKIKLRQDEVQRNLAKTAKKRLELEKDTTEAAKKGNKTLAEKCRALAARSKRDSELQRAFAGSVNTSTMTGTAKLGAFGKTTGTAEPTNAPTTPRPVVRTTSPQPPKAPRPATAKKAAARLSKPDPNNFGAMPFILDAIKQSAAQEAKIKLEVKLGKGLVEKHMRQKNARITARTGF